MEREGFESPYREPILARDVETDSSPKRRGRGFRGPGQRTVKVRSTIDRMWENFIVAAVPGPASRCEGYVRRYR